MMKLLRNLRSAHFGNGLVIYDINEIDKRTNEYKNIAFICSDRHINWKIKNPCIKVYEQVLAISYLDNRNISTTQKDKVFDNRPSDIYVITGKKANGVRFKRIYTTTPQHYNIYTGTLWKLDINGVRHKVKEYY